MINVYIVSGFLGAGKTTFIQKLLSEKKFEKVMLLENEFGEVGVDGAFFAKGLQIREINNGCICCSLQGDFEEALEEISRIGITYPIIQDCAELQQFENDGWPCTYVFDGDGNKIGDTIDGYKPEDAWEALIIQYLLR